MLLVVRTPKIASKYTGSWNGIFDIIYFRLQSGVTVRDRMENLCNNPDMADLHIQVAARVLINMFFHYQASDDQWMWGQTSKDFIVSWKPKLKACLCICGDLLQSD